MNNSNLHTILQSAISQLEPPAHTSKLFGEWQQRGPQSLSGHVVRKLRLTLAPLQSAVAANAPA